MKQLSRASVLGLDTMGTKSSTQPTVPTLCHNSLSQTVRVSISAPNSSLYDTGKWELKYTLREALSSARDDAACNGHTLKTLAIDVIHIATY